MKNINWQDDRDIYGRMLLLTGSFLFTGLRNAVDHYNVDLTDALSWGQLKSKRWLINELEKIDKDLGTVFIGAGWYAILAGMIFESNLQFEKIRSFDIDEECAAIADTVNRKYVADGWKFKATTLDVHDIKYPHTYITKKFNGDKQTLIETPDTVINTSCEHIKDFTQWFGKIPDGTLCVLQTNDYFDIDDHINCSKDVVEFASQTPFKELLYDGQLDCNKYYRFMRIGIK